MGVKGTVEGNIWTITDIVFPLITPITDDLRLWIESSIKATNAFKEVIANYHYGTNDYFDLNHI